MNAGVVEETGSTVRTFITSMRDHPAVLVLALCNLALIVFMYFGLAKAAEFRNELIKQSFEYQKQSAELLARCVLTQPGQRGEGYRLQSEFSRVVELPLKQATGLPDETVIYFTAPWNMENWPPF